MNDSGERLRRSGNSPSQSFKRGFGRGESGGILKRKGFLRSQNKHKGRAYHASKCRHNLGIKMWSTIALLLLGGWLFGRNSSSSSSQSGGGCDDDNDNNDEYCFGDYLNCCSNDSYELDGDYDD